MDSLKNSIVIKCVVTPTTLSAAQYHTQHPLEWPVLQVHEISPTLPKNTKEPYSLVFTSKHAVDMFFAKKALLENVWPLKNCLKIAAVGSDTAEYFKKIAAQHAWGAEKKEVRVAKEEQGLKAILLQEFITPYLSHTTSDVPPHAVYILTSQGGISKQVLSELKESHHSVVNMGVSTGVNTAAACAFHILPLYELHPWSHSQDWIELLLRQKNMVAHQTASHFHFVFCCRSGHVVKRVVRELCAYYRHMDPTHLPPFFYFSPWGKSAWAALLEEGLEARVITEDITEDDIDISP